MKSSSELAESIERFRRGFWLREEVHRPPVAVIPARAWLPIRYARQPLERDEVLPEDFARNLARTEYEDWFEARPVQSDDLIPYAAAWRAIPWLEAMCRCPVRTSAGSLAPGRCVASAEELEATVISSGSAWMGVLRSETNRLTQTAPADCWISTTILRGASDVLAAMRGLDNFLLDLHDDPRALARAAARIGRLHLDVLDVHFSEVGPKLSGYGHIFGYWAPAPTTVIQEDALGLCSPPIYRDLFMPLSAQIVEHLGRHVLFHLHSTGYKHYRHVLEVPGIAGLELTVEANGPRLADMLPALREILERSRLILQVDGHMDQLPEALRRLPKDGLYLILSDKFIRSEEEYRSFLEAL